MAKKKTQTTQYRRCYDCAHAYNMRSAPHNPVVALCEITGTRRVASSGFQCEHFAPFGSEPEIHPMIKCK